MAILKIVKDGDPILRKTSRAVTDINEHILTLLDDMAQTMRNANGCGLAAVQVGALRRVVVIETEPGKLIELINPSVIKREGEQQELEGCLSIPDKWGITDRPMTVTVRATGRDGKEFEVSGSGLAARAFCHEIDHLDGVLFTDNALRILTADELRRMEEEEDGDEAPEEKPAGKKRRAGKGKKDDI